MKKKLHKNILLNVVAWAVLSICMLSCSKTSSISLGTTHEFFGVQTVDTFVVEVNTLLLDPVSTAGRGTVLVGVSEDANFGKTELMSYMQFSTPDLTTEFTQDVRFDSLSLDLLYTGYSYGDTTKTFGLEVYELSEAIDPITLSIALEGDEYPVFGSSETLYSNQEFAHKNTTLGRTSFFPTPHKSQDTVRVRLSDDLGKTLFKLAQNQDSRIVNSDEFVDYFKGIVIKPSANNKSVIGFADGVSMNIYYSYERQSDGFRVTDTLKFLADNSSYNFNQVKANRSGSALEKLVEARTKVNTTSIGQRAFVQGGTGVVTQVKFPTVNSSLRSNLSIINKAQLVIEAKEPSISNTALPDSLILMRGNKYNTAVSYLTNSSGSTVQAWYQKDNTWGTSTKGSYTFDVTDFISSWIHNGQYSDDESILISLGVNELFSTVNTLEIPAAENSSTPRPAIKLIITYTKINENEMAN